MFATKDYFVDVYPIKKKGHCGDVSPSFTKVTKRLREAQGSPIGTANEKPIIDTRMYKVEYLDGFTTSMAANSIAEKMFAQVDEEGNNHVLYDEIVEHRCDGNQVNMQDAFSTNTRGVKPRRPTTKSW